MDTRTPILTRSDKILGGEPVFPKTRVLVRSLFEYLEAGDSLDDFLRQFPNVSRQQAISVLDAARDRLLQVDR